MCAVQRASLQAYKAPAKELDVCVVGKKHVKVLSVLMSNKHLHVTYYTHKAVTTALVPSTESISQV